MIYCIGYFWKLYSIKFGKKATIVLFLPRVILATAAHRCFSVIIPKAWMFHSPVHSTYEETSGPSDPSDQPASFPLH